MLTLKRCALVAFVIATSTGRVEAQEKLCATVKIEVVQELVLERQAFDARLRISNGLESAIEDLSVTLIINDADGEPVDEELFFVRVESVDGVSGGVSEGTGTIAPESVGEIHWLIIPAPGAGTSPEGTSYSIGATVNYSLANLSQEVEVQPDSITVLPMPELAVDYFITKGCVRR